MISVVDDQLAIPLDISHISGVPCNVRIVHTRLCVFYERACAYVRQRMEHPYHPNGGWILGIHFILYFDSLIEHMVVLW